MTVEASRSPLINPSAVRRNVSGDRSPTTSNTGANRLDIQPHDRPRPDADLCGERDRIAPKHLPEPFRCRVPPARPGLRISDRLEPLIEGTKTNASPGRPVTSRQTTVAPSLADGVVQGWHQAKGPVPQGSTHGPDQGARARHETRFRHPETIPADGPGRHAAQK